MKVEEHVSLKELSTMGVGGRARYLIRAASVEDVCEAIAFSQKNGLPFFVLGSGSNLVFSDRGFGGVVIKMEIGDVEFADEEGGVVVTAGAGVVWDELVAQVVERGLFGFENLSLIPGTVGASVVQNIGAYGSEVESIVRRVDAIDSDTCAVRSFSRDECSFGYRMSFFKTPEGRKYVVVRVAYEASARGDVRATYERLSATLKEKGILDPSPKDIRETVIAIRKERLPYDCGLGSAGSFFKNPVVSRETFDALSRMFPNVPSFPSGEEGSVKVPAGWLIDNACGMRGYREGDVGTYDKQALVIVNHGNANAEEIRNFAETVIARVKETTGIELEREVEYVETNEK